MMMMVMMMMAKMTMMMMTDMLMAVMITTTHEVATALQDVCAACNRRADDLSSALAL